MREIIQDAIRRSTARHTEVRFERIERTLIESRTRTLVQLLSEESEGGIVRVLAPEGGWGSATFCALSGLDRAIAAACAAAGTVTGEAVQLAPVPAAVEERRAVLKEDFRLVPLEEKREVLSELEDEILGFDPRVQDAVVFYRDTFRSVALATSEGTWIRDERPLVDLRVEAIAARGDDIQVATEGLGRVQGFECVRDQASLARTAARRAVETLDAARVAGGSYTVVTDPTLTGVFIHEAFGHLLEADHIYRNPGLAELVKPGRRVGPDFLDVTDYAVPEEPQLMGSFPYDDEGVAGGRTALIRGGVLVGRMHSRETAARFGERPTGNARAQDFRHEPLVRMSKTIIERGSTPLASIFEGIALGIYARGSRGGQTELGRYSFGAEEAYLIRDGKIAERVRDVTLTGNIFETLARIEAVGDDFKLDSRGRCGKQGQSMPVSLGGPHVRFASLIVGGRQS